MTSPPSEKLLVIGFGMGAAKLLQDLVREGYRGTIQVVGDEADLPYNKVYLSAAATGESPPELMLQDELWYGEHGIEVTRGTVSALVPADRAAVLSDGRRLVYDRLVLALGAEAIRPSIPGLELEGVCILQSLEDARLLQRQSDQAKTAVVIGAGVLGLEVADRLRLIGKKVTVIHREGWPMETHLDASSGGALAGRLRSQGIDLRLTATAVRFLGGRRVEQVELSTGDFVDAGLVVLAVGSLPRTRLAAEAGLHVEKGIVVDDYLMTSQQDIYALGDCARTKGMAGFIAPTYRQASSLASTLCGRPTEYRPVGAPVVRLKASFPMLAFGGPVSGGGGEIRYEDTSRSVVKRLEIRDGRLVRAFVLGDEAVLENVEVAYESGVPVSDRPQRLLFSDAEGAASPAVWPGSWAVCQCHNVTAGEIRAALSRSGGSLSELSSLTRAGTGCGSCRSRLRALAQAAGTSTPRSFWSRLGDVDVRGYSLVKFCSHVVDYLMLLGFLLSAVTGVLKFPGFLGWLGISLRKMPMPLIMDLHDWGSLVFTATAVLHLILHFPSLVRFAADLVRPRRR